MKIAVTNCISMAYEKHWVSLKKHDLLGIVITECINYRFGKNIWNCLALDWTECDTYIMQYL